MRTKLVRITLLSLTAVAVFSVGCKKSSKEETVVTKTVLLTTSTWKFKEAGIDSDGNGTIDFPIPATALEACVTDNTLTFKSDKSGIIDEGARKCNATDPQTAPFTWSLNAQETQINFSTAVFAGIGGDVKLIELTATNLTLGRTVTLPTSPLPAPVVVKLVH